MRPQAYFSLKPFILSILVASMSTGPAVASEYSMERDGDSVTVTKAGADETWTLSNELTHIDGLGKLKIKDDQTIKIQDNSGDNFPTLKCGVNLGSLKLAHAELKLQGSLDTLTIKWGAEINAYNDLKIKKLTISDPLTLRGHCTAEHISISQRIILTLTDAQVHFHTLENLGGIFTEQNLTAKLIRDMNLGKVNAGNQLTLKLPEDTKTWTLLRNSQFEFQSLKINSQSYNKLEDFFNNVPARNLDPKEETPDLAWDTDPDRLNALLWIKQNAIRQDHYYVAKASTKQYWSAQELPDIPAGSVWIGDQHENPIGGTPRVTSTWTQTSNGQTQSGGTHQAGQTTWGTYRKYSKFIDPTTGNLDSTQVEIVEANQETDFEKIKEILDKLSRKESILDFYNFSDIPIMPM